MSEFNDDLFGEWEENPAGDDISVLDEWFGGHAWKSVLKDADAGDHDSLELMENVSALLTSLIFHLQNDSAKERVDYEINQFRKLIEEYK